MSKRCRPAAALAHPRRRGGRAAAALALQFLGGLPPCPFCVYQRYPYLVVHRGRRAGLWLAPAAAGPRPGSAGAGRQRRPRRLPCRRRAGLARAARELRRGRRGHDDRGAAPAARGRAGALRSGGVQLRSACRSPPGTCSTPRSCCVFAASVCCAAAQQLSRTGIRAPRSTSRVAPPSTISRRRECP